MKTYSMQDYSLDNSTIMDPQEHINLSKLPATMLAVTSSQSLLSNSVKLQAIPTALDPAILNKDSVTGMTMVVDLTAAALAPVTTRGPCQDNVDDTSDPCIGHLGGETYLLSCMSANLEPNKFLSCHKMLQPPCFQPNVFCFSMS